MDAPMDANSLLSSAVRELPTVMIAMTEAIPMMIPSIVSNARILLAFKPVSASLIFSSSIIRRHPLPLTLTGDLTVFDRDYPLAFFGKFR